MLDKKMRSRIKKLGKEHKSRIWTDEEKEIFRECIRQGVYPSTIIREGLLPGKTWSALNIRWGRTKQEVK